LGLASSAAHDENDVEKGRFAMATWSADELGRIGEADELEIASRREDGTLRGFVTIWVVRLGDEIYVRSAYGTDNPWYRRARASDSGRIRAGGVERDVDFDAATDVDNEAIDAAYHEKYDRYGQKIVGTVVGALAAASTLRLAPREGA
jgi:hypothetical protein